MGARNRRMLEGTSQLATCVFSTPLIFNPVASLGL